MRKVFCFVFIFIIMLSSHSVIYAEEDYTNLECQIETISSEETKLDIKSDLISPYTLYIMGATTSIIDKEDGKIYMGVEVYCTHTMKKITTNFHLQRWISDQWVNVADHTCVLEDTDFMYAVVSVSYPPSGTYRVRTAVMVEDYNGYAEVTEGNSGDIDFISVRES